MQTNIEVNVKNENVCDFETSEQAIDSDNYHNAVMFASKDQDADLSEAFDCLGVLGDEKKIVVSRDIRAGFCHYLQDSILIDQRKTFIQLTNLATEIRDVVSKLHTCIEGLSTALYPTAFDATVSLETAKKITDFFINHDSYAVIGPELSCDFAGRETTASGVSTIVDQSLSGEAFKFEYQLRTTSVCDALNNFLNFVNTIPSVYKKSNEHWNGGIPGCGKRTKYAEQLLVERFCHVFDANAQEHFLTRGYMLDFVTSIFAASSIKLREATIHDLVRKRWKDIVARREAEAQAEAKATARAEEEANGKAEAIGKIH